MVGALLMVGVVMLSCNFQLAEASEDVSVVSEAGELGWLKANLSPQVSFFPSLSPQHLFILFTKNNTEPRPASSRKSWDSCCQQYNRPGKPHS